MRPVPVDVRYRPAGAEDVEFLTRMLALAVSWRADAAADPAAVEVDPVVSRYIAAWPLPDDLGIVAEDAAGTPLAAAWLRFFRGDAPGYGQVADDVPELTIAVDPRHRGAGLGTALLRRTLAAAAARGDRAVSLSVEHDNPAIRLYLHEGFRVVRSTPTAATMMAEVTT